MATAGTGYHIGRAGSDGGGAEHRAGSVFRLGVSSGGEYHRLFVAGDVVAEFSALQDRLTQPGNIAVTEDAPAGGKETSFFTINLNILST